MSNTWRAFTEEDVLNSMSGTEVTAYRTKLLKDGQADPLTGLLSTFAGKVRDSIRSCSENSLDEDPLSLPLSAIDVAAVLTRQRLLTRYTSTEISKGREMEYREAVDWLKRVERCVVKITPPGTDDAAKSVVSLPCIAAPVRTHRRNQGRGL